MPFACTTQLTKPRWSALKIWRHLVGFIINVEKSIFSSTDWACKRLRAWRQQGCYSALHSHPHNTFINQSPRAGPRPRLCPGRLFSCPTLLPARTSPCLHSVTRCCLGECCMAWEQPNSWTMQTAACWSSSLAPSPASFPQTECLPWVPQRQGLGLRREQKGWNSPLCCSLAGPISSDTHI